MKNSRLRYQLSKKITSVSIFINTILVIIKMAAGLIGNSSALFADGIHSLSDLLSDAMILFAAKHASKSADIEHPYGHERIETVATIILAELLIIIGGSIAYHAVSHWHNKALTLPSYLTIYIAIISILANEWLFHYTISAAKKSNSDLLATNAWHSRSDVYSSMVILIALVGGSFGFLWMDLIASVIVACIIIRIGFKWGYKSFSELIDTSVDRKTLIQIRRLLSLIEGVKKLNCLRTRKMAGHIMIDVHILVDEAISASESYFLGECIRSTLAYNISNIKEIVVCVDVTERSENFTYPNYLAISRKLIEEQLFAFIGRIGYKINKTEIELSIYYYSKQIRLYLLVKKMSKTVLSTQKMANFSLIGIKKTEVYVFYIS